MIRTYPQVAKTMLPATLVRKIVSNTSKADIFSPSCNFLFMIYSNRLFVQTVKKRGKTINILTGEDPYVGSVFRKQTLQHFLVSHCIVFL